MEDVLRSMTLYCITCQEYTERSISWGIYEIDRYTEKKVYTAVCIECNTGQKLTLEFAD